MRNLKRTLSLLLTAAMLIGMMVVGASAVSSSDFTDSDEITNIEAAQVMTALGVFEGTDSGAFDPNGTLTREQAAAIICRMLLGEDAEELTTNSVVFSDVSADRWSAGYIGYCAQQGILAGTGNGTFDPEGELTGLAFAKMCLVALGYNADSEGYVGTDWAINVAADATNAGIAVSGLVLANTISREDAAQMAFQTLEADMVTCTGSGTTYTLPAAATSSDVTITVTQSAIYSAMTGSFVITGNDDVDAEDVIIGISENSYFDNTEDVTFTVQIPDGYHLELVNWMLAGDDSATELTADENGVYTIDSADLADVDSGSNKLIIGVRLEANPTVTFSSGVTAWDAETGASLGSSTLSKVNEDGTYYLEFTCSDANLSTNAGSLSRQGSNGDYVYTLTNIPDSGATISSSGT